MTVALTMFLLVMTGCASNFSTRSAGVDYNRSFSGSRNDLLVLNVLRAAAREPLQFSTISSVAGGMRPTPTLKIPFTNLIAGGADVISPEINIGIRNPNVTITPLDTREFMAGIVRPVSYQTINHMMTSGPWPADALMLVVGGVECSDGTRIINSGSVAALDDQFRSVLSANVQDLEWSEVSGATTELRMTPAQAMDHLDDTLTGGRQIVSVTPVSAPAQTGKDQPQGAADASSRDVIVTVRNSTSAALTGDNLGEVCQRVSGSRDAKAKNVIIRSIQAMFNYLGEVHRRNEGVPGGRCAPFLDAARPRPAAAFQFHSYCDERSPPVNAVASANFHGRVYFVLRDEDVNPVRSGQVNLCGSANAQRAGLVEALRPEAAGAKQMQPAGPGPERRRTLPYDAAALLAPPSGSAGAPSAACDRTLIMLSLLGDMIALQTSDSTLATSRPVIAISPQ